MATGDRRARRLAGGITAAGVLVIAAAGLLLRIWALGRAPVGSDQAIVGLMAHEILHGHTFAFYWGQDYGGAEPYVTAALFALFGQSAITLGLTAVLLDAVAALLVWRIGNRLFPRPAGTAAALLFWIWPEVYVWQSTVEYGFRWVALVCGLVALLVVLRLGDDTGTRRLPTSVDALVLGAAVGIGWWATPEVAYYLLPAGGLLVVRLLRRQVRVGPVAVGCFLLAAGAGSLPWWWDNATRGFPSLHAGPQQQPGFGEHLRVFATHSLPLLLGLRLPVSGAWLGGSAIGLVLYAAALLGGATFIVVLARRRAALVLVAFAVLAPFLYAYSPFTWYWQDGRYALYLAPVASLLAASAACDLAGRVRLPVLRVELRPRVRGLLGSLAVLAAGVALTTGAVLQVAPFHPVPVASSGRTGWLSWHADPNGWLAPSVAALETHGVTHAYAGYWIAEALAFESRSALTVSDVLFDRYPPYLVAIEADPRAAWLFADPAHLGAAAFEVGTTLLDPGCIGGYRSTPVAVAGTSGCLEPGELETYLRAGHDRFAVFRAGDLLAIVPARPVVPLAVLAAAGVLH